MVMAITLSRLLVIISLVFFFSPDAAEAIIFRLPSGRVKCLSDDLRYGSLSLIAFRLADDPHAAGHKISATVMDPKGETIHRADDVETGQFAFAAAETGKYTSCLWSPRFELEAAVSVDFEWKSGVAAKDWASVAKKGKIDVMGLELQKIESFINSIHEEMMFLRNREEESWRLNEATNSRMAFLSLCSFLICMGVASLQLWHLKSFFERRKIL